METSRFKTFWDGVKKFSIWFGNIQARIVLTLIYFLILPFFALIYKIFGRDSFKNVSTFWIDKEKREQTIEDIKREW